MRRVAGLSVTRVDYGGSQCDNIPGLMLRKATVAVEFKNARPAMSIAK
jgi:hypothetical protein